LRRAVVIALEAVKGIKKCRRDCPRETSSDPTNRSGGRTARGVYVRSGPADLIVRGVGNRTPTTGAMSA
jgi:hypothetical protein